MTKDAGFKRVVPRQALETGRRHTQAPRDFEGLDSRMLHRRVAEHLVAHVGRHKDIDALADTQVGRHLVGR